MIKAILLFSILLWTCSDCYSNSYSDTRRQKFESGFYRNESIHLYSANYDNSRLYFLAIIDTSERAGFWDICLQALSDLAYISSRNFNYQAMKKATEKGQRIVTEKSKVLDTLDPQYSIRAEMMTMVGSCYLKYNDTEKASAIFEALVKQLESVQHPDKESLFTTYSYIAESYMNLGLYEKVYTYYLLAEKSIPDGPGHNYCASYSDQYMATYFYRIKNYARAKWYLLRSLKIIKGELLTKDWKALLIYNYDLLALAHEYLNQHDSAMFYLKKSLALQNIRDPGIVDTYENYGDCLMRFHDFTGAISYYQRILKILNHNTYGNSFKFSQVYSKIAECHQNLENDRECLKLVQQALCILYRDSSYLVRTEKNPDIASIQPDKVLIRLLIIKSNALYRISAKKEINKSMLMSSLSTFHLTTLVIDEFRQKISTDDFKEFFVSDIRPMYDNAVKACYAAYSIEPGDSLADLALYFMEKSKNQVLLDAIRANYAKKSGKIPESLVVRENQYKNTKVELQNTLYRLKYNNADPAEINQNQYEYAKNQSDYSAFLNELEKNYPDYYSLKYRDKVPTMDEIRRIIKNNQLIEYMVGDDYLAMISLSDNKSVFKLIRNNSGIKMNLLGILNDVSGKNVNEGRMDPKTFNRFVHHAGFLYSLLLKPALDKFSHKDHLIIIPDGLLCFLPFEVLIMDIPGNLQLVDYRDLNYVMKEYIIRYEFSAELLFKKSTQSNKSKRAALYLGFAPSYEQKNGLRKVKVLGSRISGYLTPLKFSSKEIEEASSIFRGKAYFGNNANAKSFKENVPFSKIIHFAGHTIINDSIPELSGIFFSDVSSGNSSPPGKGDEVIYVNEILNLNMSANLVILSACETGIGKLVQGEGLMSIGRAFKYAGCPNLVISLWKINDRSATEIINRFNRNLKKGQNKDVALRNAKIDYLNSNRVYSRSHPFYWSAFILIGDNEPLFHKKRIVPLASGLLLISIYAFYRVRKRHSARSSILPPG
jgi:CHAT domain-containing protein/Tfp pilus assembly protein PilF